MLDTVQDYIDAKLTHSLHTSESKSFRGCRRRWNWLFREYWYPTTTAKPLEFGVAYHKAAEVAYAPLLWDKPEQVVIGLARVAFHDKCAEQKKAYIDAEGNWDEEVHKDFEERLKLGFGMIEYFIKTSRRKDIEAGFKPIGVEVKFEVPILNPAYKGGENPTGRSKHLWCKCDTCWNRFVAYMRTIEPSWQNLDNDPELYPQRLWRGLPVTYGGRIDAILQGPDGRIWVVDWKTATQLSVDRDEFLLLDDQISRYLWALRLQGHRVAGFIYHEQKKGIPTEPEPMQRRRLGRLFSINQQQDVEFKTYKETVEENDPEAYSAGLYDDYLAYLESRGEFFSARYPVYRNDRELDSVGQTIWDESSDMVDSHLRIYPNAGRFNCTNCAFRQPCLGMNSDEDYQFTLRTMFEKRRYHYWEEQELSTDKTFRG